MSMMLEDKTEDGRITWKFPPIPADWGFHNPNFRSIVFRVKAWCVRTKNGNFMVEDILCVQNTKIGKSIKVQ